jgi:hypothetical protein
MDTCSSVGVWARGSGPEPDRTRAAGGGALGCRVCLHQSFSLGIMPRRSRRRREGLGDVLEPPCSARRGVARRREWRRRRRRRKGEGEPTQPPASADDGRAAAPPSSSARRSRRRERAGRRVDEPPCSARSMEMVKSSNLGGWQHAFPRPHAPAGVASGRSSLRNGFAG